MRALVFSVLIAISIFFTGLAKVNAAIPGWAPPENYREGDSIGMSSELPEDNQKPEISQDEKDINDLFGDEQFFPFEPGLGNSAF